MSFCSRGGGGVHPGCTTLLQHGGTLSLPPMHPLDALPPWMHPHLSGCIPQMHPLSPLQQKTDKRSVRILLECILVVSLLLLLSSGRIMNRFSRDLDVLDMNMPTHLRQWLLAVAPIFTTVILICYSTPIFTVIMVPLGVIFVMVQVS